VVFPQLVARHFPQHRIDPAIAHHHLQQLRGGLDFSAAGERLCGAQARAAAGAHRGQAPDVRGARNFRRRADTVPRMCRALPRRRAPLPSPWSRAREGGAPTPARRSARSRERPLPGFPRAEEGARLPRPRRLTRRTPYPEITGEKQGSVCGCYNGVPLLQPSPTSKCALGISHKRAFCGESPTCGSPALRVNPSVERGEGQRVAAVVFSRSLSRAGYH
jgi:hypothetical protein